MTGENFEFDFDYQFHPEWSPPGCAVRPWFITSDPDYPLTDDYWAAALRYRAEKTAFVRRQLQSVHRPAALRKIMPRVWDGARDARQRHDRLIHFVQRMMIHPLHEQPLDADAVRTLRHDCCPPTDHADPYPE